jgi:hypothetical protein
MTFDGCSTARTCHAVALAKVDPYEFAMYYDVCFRMARPHTRLPGENGR